MIELEGALWNTEAPLMGPDAPMGTQWEFIPLDEDLELRISREDH